MSDATGSLLYPIPCTVTNAHRTVISDNGTHEYLDKLSFFIRNLSLNSISCFHLLDSDFVEVFIWFLQIQAYMHSTSILALLSEISFQKFIAKNGVG